MNTYFVTVAAALAIFSAMPAHAAEGLAYEDNKLNLRNCAGENVTARWFGTDLSLSRAGTSPAEPEPMIEYQTWDGTCEKMGWDSAKAEFKTTSGGTAGVSRIVRYIAWDGAKWAAGRTGPGFYIARITRPDEPHTAEAFDAAARWLRRKDGSNIGAMALAESLAAEFSKSQ